jgi:Tfp pilus assembly protein PilE
MKIKRKQFGLSLTEVLTSIVIVVLLAAMSMPAINALVNSTSSTGSSEAMISAAMSNARAIAMKEQRYAGVRFQKVYNPDKQNQLDWEQYMIFIIHDPALGAYFFRATEGLKPIKLPPNIGVMDFTIVENKENDPVKPYNEIHINDPYELAAIGANADDLLEGLNGPKNLSDIGTFSIIFSPTGNLVVHGVRVRNKDGQTDDSSSDDVFNTAANVRPPKEIGMFYQDDYYGAASPYVNLGPEPSRRQFYIYEQDKFKRAYEQGTPYSGYLTQLKPVYINSYTGTIISAGQ